MSRHQVTPPKGRYNPADGSISINDGAGVRHFPDADAARLYYLACIQEIGRVDPATKKAATK